MSLLEGSGRRKASLAGTVGVLLSHPRGCCGSWSLREASAGVCGWKGLLTRALRLQSGGSQWGGLALGAWLPGKGIVLVLLTEPQPTCRTWLGSCNWPG